MCTKKYKSYEDYACENDYYPLFNEISNAETRLELLKIVNGEYKLETLDSFENMFDHLKINPNIQIDTCYKTVGNLYVEMLQYEKALKVFSLAHQYGSINALIYMCNIYKLQHNKQKARVILLPLVEENHPYACAKYSEFLYEDKKYEDAEKYALIAIENGDILVTQLLGHIYLATKHFDKISEYEKIIKESIELEKKYSDILYNGDTFCDHIMTLSRLYRSAGNNEMALSTLEMINTNHRYKFVAMAEKASIYAENGDMDKAFQELDMFEESNGFEIIKEKNMRRMTGELKKVIILFKLSQCYTTRNVGKLVYYLSMCSPREIKDILKRLKRLGTDEFVDTEYI